MSASTISHFRPPQAIHFGMPCILAIWIGRMRDRARDRDLLARMSDRELLDMRATRYELQNELAKPFWRG